MLSLATGESDSVVAESCTISVWEFREKVGNLSGFTCLLDFSLRGGPVSDSNILAERHIKYIGLLTNDSYT